MNNKTDILAGPLKMFIWMLKIYVDKSKIWICSESSKLLNYIVGNTYSLGFNVGAFLESHKIELELLPWPGFSNC